MEIYKQHQPHQLPLSPLGFTRGPIVSNLAIRGLFVRSTFKSNSCPKISHVPIEINGNLLFSQIWHTLLQMPKCYYFRNNVKNSNFLLIIIYIFIEIQMSFSLPQKFPWFTDHQKPLSSFTIQLAQKPDCLHFLNERMGHTL